MKNSNILNFLTLQNHGVSDMHCANYTNKMTDLLEGFREEIWGHLHAF
jgi:hypothetical protein